MVTKEVLRVGALFPRVKQWDTFRDILKEYIGARCADERTWKDRNNADFHFHQKNPKKSKTMADKVSSTIEQIGLSKSDEEQQKLLILFPNLSVHVRRQKSPTDACDNVHLLPLDWNDWIVENENETPEMKSLKSGVLESANNPKIDAHESCNTEQELSPSSCPTAFTSNLMPSVTLRVVVNQVFFNLKLGTC